MNNYLLGRQGPSFISVVRHSKQTKSESTFHYFILPFCNETTGENTVGNWQRNQIYHNIRYVSTKTNLIRTCGFLLANLPIEKELRNVSGNFSDELKSNPYDKVPCFSYQKVPRGQGLWTQRVKQDALETQSFRTPVVTTSFSEAQGSRTKESLARPEKDGLYKVNSEGAISCYSTVKQVLTSQCVWKVYLIPLPKTFKWNYLPKVG